MKKKIKTNNLTIENRGNGIIKMRASKKYGDKGYYNNGPETNVSTISKLLKYIGSAIFIGASTYLSRNKK